MMKGKIWFMILCLLFASAIAYFSDWLIILLSWGFGVTLCLWVNSD